MILASFAICTAHAYADQDDDQDNENRAFEHQQEVNRAFGIVPGQVQNFEKDDDEMSRRAAEWQDKYAPDFRRHWNQQFESDQSTSPDNHSSPDRDEPTAHRHENFLVHNLPFFNRLLILLSLCLAIVPLRQNTTRPIFKWKGWSRKVDPFAILGSTLLTYFMLWIFPGAGESALLFFFAIVIPTSAIGFSWCFFNNSLLKEKANKSQTPLIIVAYAAILALQFSFGSWLWMLIKSVVVLPSLFLLVRHPSRFVYRALTAITTCSGILQIPGFLRGSTFVYATFQLTLDAVVLFLVSESFLRFESRVAEDSSALGTVWLAGRLLLKKKSRQTPAEATTPPIPPPPPPRWYVFENEVTQGPFSNSELRAGVEQGRWGSETQICLEGSALWRHLAEVFPLT